MADVIVLKDNGDGTYLGADETGALYDGLIHQVGFDELETVTTLTEIGFERVTSYMGHLHSKGNMTRDSFDAERIAERTRMQQDNPDQNYPDLTQAELDEKWAAEVDLTSNGKAYFQTPDGPVEKTLKFLIWTPKAGI